MCDPAAVIEDVYSSVATPATVATIAAGPAGFGLDAGLAAGAGAAAEAGAGAAVGGVIDPLTGLVIGSGINAGVTPGAAAAGGAAATGAATATPAAPAAPLLNIFGQPTPADTGQGAAIGGATATPAAPGAALPMPGTNVATGPSAGAGPGAGGVASAPGSAAPSSVPLSTSTSGPLTDTQLQSALDSASAPTPNKSVDAALKGLGITPQDATAAGSAAAGKATSIENLFNDPSLSNLGKAAGSNLGTLISAGGLGYSALTQPKIPSITSAEGAISNTAGQLSTQATQLESYLSTGTLPPGVQASLNSAADSAKAAIRSRYAAMGSSGSSAEQQDLANVDTTVVSQGANIALQLLNQGVSESQLSAQLYSTILNTALQQNQNLSTAIGNFASAAAGGTGLTLKLANG